MSKKHTPGPWVYHSGAVWKDGVDVYPKGSEDGIPIAKIHREPGSGTLPVERDANARLIAAAPELLEAIEWFLCHHRITKLRGVSDTLEDRFKTLETAINKAKD